MTRASSDVWEVMSTARTIRRFTDEPVDDATLRRCLEAATWAPSGANAQAWRFIVLRSPEQRAVVAKAAAHALAAIEPVYSASSSARRGGEPRPLGPAGEWTLGRGPIPVDRLRGLHRGSLFPPSCPQIIGRR